MKDFTVVWKGQISGPYDEKELLDLIDKGEVREVHTILHGGLPVNMEDLLPPEAVAVPQPTPAPPSPPKVPLVAPSPPVERSQPVAPSPPPIAPPEPAVPRPSPIPLEKPKHSFLPARDPSANKPTLPSWDDDPEEPPPRKTPKASPPPPPRSAPPPSAFPTATNHQPPPSAYIPPGAIYPQQRTSGLGVASMVLGIVGILTLGMLLIPQLLAVVFGDASLSECRRNPLLGGRGMAIAGLTMGWIMVALNLLGIALFLIGQARMSR